GHDLTATLTAILSARLAALSPAGRAAAGAVAAAVGPVPHRILAEVAGLDEPALLAGLRECVDRHVLVAHAAAGTYAFRHSLLREAAYAALLPGEATRLHAAYGRALPAARSTGSPPTVADLAAAAWHLYAAGDAEAALPAALAAGLAAETASGYAEARQQFERALVLADRLPAESVELVGRDGGEERFDRTGLAERAADAAQLAGDPARAVELLELALTSGRKEDGPRLLLALGRARWAAGNSDGAFTAFDEAIGLLPDLETEARVRALAAAAEVRMLAGRYGESRRIADDALAAARRLDLGPEEAEILGTLGVDLAFLGDAEPAVEALGEAVDVAERALEGDGAEAGLEPGRTAPQHLAQAVLNRAEVLSGPLNRLDEAADVA
ncbi:MAG: tetratricopeptide repeat protein, partial [Actinobacteria bacterium]|nr:tetratricopeptide repeat protein [Actinomycetota bacterium]